MLPHELGRGFIGCDIAWGNEMEQLEVAPRVIDQANKQLGFDFGEIACSYVEDQQGFRREPDDGGETVKRSTR